MGNIPLYPLKFKPILKHYLWGGHNLARLFPGKIDSTEPVAESWEISDLGADVSVVANGDLAGTSLRTLLETRGEEVLGKGIFDQTKGEFPLLVKLIDAEDQLSIQVHPDEDYAQQHETGEHGKTEMWYLLETSDEAKLYCGFQPGVTKEQFLNAEKSEQYESLLQSYQTQPGEAYYIPAGTIHSIGKGNILFEVQVSSNLTYRLYDWGRVDKSTGKPRQTHLDKSKEVIQFENSLSGKTEPQPIETNELLQKEKLVHCPFFKVDKWSVKKSIKLDIGDAFRIFCFFQGFGELSSGHFKMPFQPGDAFLIPSCLDSVEISASDSEVALLNVSL